MLVPINNIDAPIPISYYILPIHYYEYIQSFYVHCIKSAVEKKLGLLLVDPSKAILSCIPYNICNEAVPWLNRAIWHTYYNDNTVLVDNRSPAVTKGCAFPVNIRQ